MDRCKSVSRGIIHKRREFVASICSGSEKIILAPNPCFFFCAHLQGPSMSPRGRTGTRASAGRTTNLVGVSLRGHGRSLIYSTPFNL